MRLWILVWLALASAIAEAGFIEIGVAGNYRRSGYDKNNFIETISYNGNLAYYFWESCALELNYTTGYSKQVTKGSPTDPETKVEDNIDLTALDLVLSPSSRQDPFRPYIKLGAGYLVKQRFRQIDSDDKDLISEQRGVVPSGGVGLSLNLTKELSLKFGVDAWTSPLKIQPVIVDYAGRAGISFIF